MTSKEIKNCAENQIEKNFDALMFFSIVADIILFITRTVPVVGSAIVSPLTLSTYDVFSKTDVYKKVTVNDFTKYFKTQWHTTFTYAVRQSVYVFLPLVVTLVITLICPIIIVVTGIIMFVELIIAIGKGFSTAMGNYLIYKDPELSSKQALEKSIELMNGNRWRLFKLYFSLIPQFVQCILLGYGLPKINRSIQIFFEEIYNPTNEKEPITTCPKCGEARKNGANFCPNCGYNFNEE